MYTYFPYLNLWENGRFSDLRNTSLALVWFRCTPWQGSSEIFSSSPCISACQTSVVFKCIIAWFIVCYVMCCYSYHSAVSHFPSMCSFSSFSYKSTGHTVKKENTSSFALTSTTPEGYTMKSVARRAQSWISKCWLGSGTAQPRTWANTGGWAAASAGLGSSAGPGTPRGPGTCQRHSLRARSGVQTVLAGLHVTLGKGGENWCLYFLIFACVCCFPLPGWPPDGSF